MLQIGDQESDPTPGQVGYQCSQFSTLAMVAGRTPRLLHCTSPI
jgi:hypothetical protein